MPILDDDQLRNMHAVLNLLLPALFNFITLKFHGSTNSPFDPVTMFFSVSPLLLYCSLSLRLVARGTRFFGLLMILSFCLSIALPTWLLFPGPCFFLLHLPVLILISADHLYVFVQERIRLMLEEIPALVFPHLFAGRLPGGRAPELPPV